MAFTGKSNTNKAFDGGGNQDDVQRGTFAFDGTAQTLELPVKLSKIREASFTVAGSTGDTVFLDEAPDSTTGVVDVDDDGEVTVKRTGSTADVQVLYALRGASKDY